MAGYAAAVGAVLGTIGAGLEAKRKKKIKKKGRQAARQILEHSARGLEASSALDARSRAAEESKLAVLMRMGQPGSYGPTAAKPGLIGPSQQPEYIPIAPTAVADPGGVTAQDYNVKLNARIKELMQASGTGAMSRYSPKRAVDLNTIRQQAIESLEAEGINKLDPTAEKAYMAAKKQYDKDLAIFEKDRELYTTAGDIYRTDASQDPALKGILRDRLPEDLARKRAGVLDPNKYASQIAQTKGFQIQSQLVAEAEQLLNQDGPAWDRLANSTLGRIYEGSAIMQRESMRKIKNNLAKGGSARKQAFAEAQQILAQERSMQMRVNQTWQANNELFWKTREYVQKINAGTADYINDLPLIGESFMNTMRANTATYMAALENAKAGEAQALDMLMKSDSPGVGEAVLGFLGGALMGGGGALMGSTMQKAFTKGSGATVTPTQKALTEAKSIHYQGTFTPKTSIREYE